MKYYIQEGDASPAASFSIEKSVFGDMKAEIELMQIREHSSPVVDIGIGGTVATSPIAHEGVVYFGCCDKNFYAVDAGSGEEIWRFPTNGPINASPAMSEGALYFGSYDGVFYALNLGGELLWKFETNDKIFSRAAVHEGKVYFGSMDGNFYALDARSGRELWRFGTAAKILSWPVVYENAVYFGSCDYNFYCLNLDGTLKWKFGTSKEAGVFNPVAMEGVVYFGSFDCNVYALDSETGSMLWRFTLTEPPNTVFCMKDGMVMFGSRNCKFYCLTSKGRKLWEYKTGNVLGGGATVHESIVYFNGSEGALYAVDIKTGKLVWKFTTEGYVGHTNPAIYKGRIYFGCWDCNLYCITMDSELVWRFRTSLSYPAPIELEGSEPQRSFEVVWKSEEEAESRKGEIQDAGVSDYGEFRGAYIDDSKSDYAGGFGKKGYKSG